MAVLRAPADLPVVPAGGGAGASCSSGCRVLDSDAGAADTPPDDPVLQPAQHATEKQTDQLKDYHVGERYRYKREMGVRNECYYR